jgi:hypothetical protein
MKFERRENDVWFAVRYKVSLLLRLRMFMARKLRLHECLTCKANLKNGGSYACEFHKSEWIR